MEGEQQSQGSDQKRQFDNISRLAATKTPEELVFTYKGIQYPTLLCSPETFVALEKDFHPRPDDAMVVSYPKCGFNWAFQLLTSMAPMVNKDVEGYIDKVIPLLEFGKPEKFKVMEESPAPRMYGTHLYYDDIPNSLFQNKTKMLVIFRNPKDTAVSFFHFYNRNPMLPSFKSWDEFFTRFMAGEVLWGSYFKHAVTWNKHMDDPNVMVVTYEELKEDLTAGVKKIAEFLQYSFTEEQIQSIAEGGTFGSMQEKYKTKNASFGQVLFRKGEVGDWKNLFTEAQSQEMDAKFEKCLAGTALGKKLNYNVYCKY